MAAGMTLVAACSGGNGKASSGSSESPSTAKTVPYVMLTPNMSGFTKPDDDTKCYNGGDRPCAVLLREAPTPKSDYVVATTGNIVPWPKEAYGSFAGNALKIVCQVRSYKLRDFKGDTPSDIWNVVETPVENLKPATQAELNGNSKTTFGVAPDKTAIYSYASAEWFGKFGRTGLLPQLAPCTPEENPAGYPAAA